MSVLVCMLPVVAYATTDCAALADNLVANCGFESSDVVPGNGGSFQDGGSYRYDDNGTPPWSFVGSAGISANGSLFQNITGNYPAIQGAHVAFIQTYPPGSQASIVSQTINFPTDGSYTLTFEAAQRVYGGLRHSFQVQFDTSYVGGVFAPWNGGVYNSYAITISNASAGPHRLAFVGDPSLYDATVFLDNVGLTLDRTSAAPDTGSNSGPSATATPELDSGLLFSSGLFGLAGYALTRLRMRKRQ